MQVGFATLHSFVICEVAEDDLFDFGVELLGLCLEPLFLLELNGLDAFGASLGGSHAKRFFEDGTFGVDPIRGLDRPKSYLFFIAHIYSLLLIKSRFS